MGLHRANLLPVKHVQQLLVLVHLSCLLYCFTISHSISASLDSVSRGKSDHKERHRLILFFLAFAVAHYCSIIARQCCGVMTVLMCHASAVSRHTVICALDLGCHVTISEHADYSPVNRAAKFDQQDLTTLLLACSFT